MSKPVHINGAAPAYGYFSVSPRYASVEPAKSEEFDQARLVVIDLHGPPLSFSSLSGTFDDVKQAPVRIPHGREVVGVARAQGFQGTVYPFENLSTPFRQASRMKDSAEAGWDKNETPGQLRSSLYAEVLSNRVALLNSISEDLETLHQQKVSGTVVNVSLGSGLAGAVLSVFDRRYGDDAKQHEEGYQGKRFCRAFDCDHSRFISDDPAIAMAESRKMLEKLLEFAETTSDDLEFRASKARYDDAVTNFVENRNSLVVAASNEGDFAETLNFLSGTPLQIPSHFQANDLAHPRAVVVGAVEQKDGKLEVASYSSDYQGVNFYANGQVVGGKGDGTSFAAPRVAAVLAQLHHEHKDETSGAIEDLLRKKFSNPLEDYQGRKQAPVLDEVAAHEYLMSDRTLKVPAYQPDPVICRAMLQVESNGFPLKD